MMYWGVLVLLLVGLYFFGLPLVILNVTKVEVMPKVQRVDPAVPLPTVVQQHLDQVGDELHHLGFEDRRTLLLPSATPNTIAVLRLYVNRTSRVSAMANSLFASAGTQGAPMMSHQAYVEFTTRYEGGETFNTHNASVPSSFPPAPKTLTVRVPWISDVKQVFKIHEAVSAAKGGTGRKVLRLDEKFGGDEVTYVQDCMHEELEHASENGYWQRSASNTHYVPTIRGAYFMTWKQLAPIKQVRAYFARLRTQRMLRELGVG